MLDVLSGMSGLSGLLLPWKAGGCEILLAGARELWTGSRSMPKEQLALKQRMKQGTFYVILPYGFLNQARCCMPLCLTARW